MSTQPTDPIEENLLDLQSHLMHFALSLTEDIEEARDLLQETSLKVLDKQTQYAESSNFKGWAFTLMRNIFINNYRKETRLQHHIATLTPIHEIETPTPQTDHADAAYDMHEIRQGISKLSKELRTPFVLYLMGYKYNEIAERTHIPLGTVKNRIYLARLELRDQLAEFNNK